MIHYFVGNDGCIYLYGILIINSKENKEIDNVVGTFVHPCYYVCLQVFRYRQICVHLVTNHLSICIYPKIMKPRGPTISTMYICKSAGRFGLKGANNLWWPNNFENNQELYTKSTPSFRTSRGTDKATADNTQSVNSSMNIYVSYIFRVLIIFRFFCIFDTINLKTCDYLYLNNEIYFSKPSKMFDSSAERKLRNKNRVKQS